MGRERVTLAPRERVAHVLATWFGCGHVPGAPGTVGTLGALPLYYLVRSGGALVVGLTAILATIVGVWSAEVEVRRTGGKDPQHIVIDEVAGVLVGLTAARPSLASVVTGVVLFRVFDQLKPWPARAAERSLPGGWGVVMDDVFAGLWAAAVLVLLHRLGVLS